MNLQESFGGNAITMMFATLSPDNKAHQENLHTLQLAVMAKNIKNKVKLNLVGGKTIASLYDTLEFRVA